MNRKFEVLAPAGSLETFYAVIEAGADAVYVGGTQFGARAYADNFDKEQLLEALDYAHIRNRKVYLTVNTLLKNSEIEQLYDYLLPYYEHGLDAVIVQDFGVFSFVSREFPLLPIHTSTQMTVAGASGAALMKEAGAKRIVCAREMSLSEIAGIHTQVNIELEAFVHGALCYCYSGMCLMSSMLGGRSGNRGKCAQPCRLPYTVCDENCKPLQPETHILSPKDLCAIQLLPQLYEAGVYSLKIEGRMKQAQYAAGVTAIYRKYASLAEEESPYLVSEEDYQTLLGLGNRSGFTSGYFQQYNGMDMITFQKPSHTKTDFVQTLPPSKGKEAAAGELVLKKGRPAMLTICCQGHTVAVSGKEALPAQNRPLCYEEVQNRMRKTNDTPFYFQTLTIDMEPDVFLPNSALNQLRRDALLQIQEAILRPYRRKCPDASELKASQVFDSPLSAPESGFCSDVSRQKAEERIEWIAATENRALLPVLCNTSYLTAIYLDCRAYHREQLISELKEDIRQIHSSKKRAYFMLPVIFRDKTADFYQGLSQKLKETQIDGFVVRSYDALQFLRNNYPEYPFVLDHNMYTLNDSSVKAFYKYRPERDTLPLELNRKELFQRMHLSSEWIIYGFLPLMVSAQCICKNTKGCRHKPELMYLKDRYGKTFPVKNNCQECDNVIYNSLPIMLFPFLPDGKRMGIKAFRLSFTIESPQQTKEILSLLAEYLAGNQTALPAKWQENHTNGHYKRGVE